MKTSRHGTLTGANRFAVYLWLQAEGMGVDSVSSRGPETDNHLKFQSRDRNVRSVALAFVHDECRKGEGIVRVRFFQFVTNSGSYVRPMTILITGATARASDALMDGRRIREDLGFRPKFPRLSDAVAASSA
jgi:hypothetical protein